MVIKEKTLYAIAFIFCLIAYTHAYACDNYCPSNGNDNSIKIGDISFDVCDISVEENIDIVEQKGLVWCKGRYDRVRNISFKSCSLYIPKEISRQFELFSNNSQEILLDNCQVNIPGRVFHVGVVRQKKCRIIYKNIHEQ